MSKRPITKFFAVLMIPLLSVRPALSQDQPPQRLTLHEAVRLALKQNPQTQIANLRLAESEQDRAIARSALLPQATFEVARSAERINLGSSFGAKLPGIPHHAGPFEVFQSGPAFSLPILDLNLWRNWQASHRAVKASEADDETVREETVSFVVSQYLAALRCGTPRRFAHFRATRYTAGS